MEVYGKRMKELREEKGLSQKRVGEFLGCSQRCYAGYELRQRDTPTEVLCKLADYYETSADYLLGRTNRRKPYPSAEED